MLISPLSIFILTQDKLSLPLLTTLIRPNFIISHFIIYSGVFLGGDPTKLEEDHKSRSALVGRDSSLICLGSCFTKAI